MKKTKQLHKSSAEVSNRPPTPDQIWKFLEDYASIAQGRDQQTEMISVRIPKNVLEAFKARAKFENLKYQTQIVQLMRAWLLQNPKS